MAVTLISAGLMVLPRVTLNLGLSAHQLHPTWRDDISIIGHCSRRINSRAYFSSSIVQLKLTVILYICFRTKISVTVAVHTVCLRNKIFSRNRCTQAQNQSFQSKSQYCTLYSVQCTYLYALEQTFSEYSNYTIYMCLRTIHSRSTEPVHAVYSSCRTYVSVISHIVIRHTVCSLCTGRKGLKTLTQLGISSMIIGQYCRSRSRSLDHQTLLSISSMIIVDRSRSRLLDHKTQLTSAQ